MDNWLEENCTTLEQSRQLAELGIMDGVEADGYYGIGRDEGSSWELFANAVIKEEASWEHPPVIYWNITYPKWNEEFEFGSVFTWSAKEPIPAYRLDKVLSELPRCYSDKGDLCIGSTRAYHHDLMNLFLSKGAKAIAAAVELLVLLKKEKDSES